jgi:sulfate adenylyltransferase subunit 2
MENDLKELEERSIFILREAKSRFKNLAALWSTGKDSTTMLAIARKAFFGKIPFPVIHIDNGKDFPETYAFREKLSKEWGFRVIVAKSVISKDDISGISCCGHNKTVALMKVMKKYKFDGLIVSIRRDEHGIRGKERYFSPRDKNMRWDFKNQPPEIWDFVSKFEGSDHVRIHPLLHWTEIDIWRYIKQEKIPVNPLYFSRNGLRYRSLGCTLCTVAIRSDAKTVDEIIEELKNTKLSERAGRAQDKERLAVMERLRALGYM